VGEEPLEDSGAEARPDEAGGNVPVGRVELPLLEHELDLPPKPVEPCDEIEGERSARQIPAKSGHRLLVARQHDHAEADHALVLAVATFVLDVEIDAAVQTLRDEA
jgi:hypothetical protein